MKTRETEKKRMPANAILAFGITWLIYGLLFPIQNIFHVILVFVISRIVAGFVSWRTRKRLPKPVEPPADPLPRTAETESEEVLAMGRAYIEQLLELDKKIIDVNVNERVKKMSAICARIFKVAAEDENKAQKIQTFTQYYLPTTIKLLETYERMEKEPKEATNIQYTRNEIANILDTVLAAFQKYLDSLYEDVILDIQVDMEVLEQMMARDGLLDKEARTKSDAKGDPKNG